MTAVEIIKMAIKELSSPFDKDLVCFTHQELTNFVNLIAASEREAMAKLCDKAAKDWEIYAWDDDADEKYWHKHIACEECAETIRARSQP
jgi:hypothetical protein